MTVVQVSRATPAPVPIDPRETTAILTEIARQQFGMLGYEHDEIWVDATSLGFLLVLGKQVYARTTASAVLQLIHQFGQHAEEPFTVAVDGVAA